ncbi:hypothetical protein FJO98_15270 [Enterococcus sp. PF-2]|nr:hypothetical protein CXM95_08085 [Enterococcus sp. CR-Ec1]AVC42276.1 hypothetical protein AL523_18260 [Enterococcus gallinarum]EPH66096.1 hypothetical protein D931_01335 [Enterococcus faecium 13.SD.W.09]MBO1098403.1 hypothetical protein [Enterococcus casseliflavus]TPE00196.1 hypothetical protein FJP08_15705 [Enterococcus sp. PF-3]TPE23532.1 hypothetical protein FJO98_15270 [Enterococcus sp. PF-2]
MVEPSIDAFFPTSKVVQDAFFLSIFPTLLHFFLRMIEASIPIVTWIYNAFYRGEQKNFAFFIYF